MLLLLYDVLASQQCSYTDMLTRTFKANVKGKSEYSLMFTKVKVLKNLTPPTSAPIKSLTYTLPKLKWYCKPIYSIGLPLLIVFICELFYTACVTNTYWIDNPDYKKFSTINDYYDEESSDLTEDDYIQV